MQIVAYPYPEIQCVQHILHPSCKTHRPHAAKIAGPGGDSLQVRHESYRFTRKRPVRSPPRLCDYTGQQRHPVREGCRAQETTVGITG
jgi:hypothetical protein